MPDVAALQAARVNMDTPLSINVEDIDLRFALNIMFKPLRLTYVIEDQVLKITTDGRQTKILSKTYKVADILFPMSVVYGENEERLMELIRYAVAKNTWEELGGNCRIQFIAPEKALRINQTQEVHEEIEQLLASLRRLYDLTVNIDVRLVHALPATAQEWRKRFTDDEKFVALDEAQCLRFLKDASGDPGIRITQIPTLTVFNGQRIAPEYARKVQSFAELKFPATTAIETEKEVAKIQSSWRCELKPVVSPDRHFVRTAVNFEHFVNDEVKSVAHRLTASREFNVADGSTIAWHVGESAGQHLFVIVTPRVRVVREQEERLFIGEIAPIPGR